MSRKFGAIFAAFLLVRSILPAAVYLDGSSYVTGPTSLTGDPTTAVSVTAWVKATTTTKNIVAQKFSNSGNQGWILYQDSVGNLRFAVVLGGTFRNALTGALDLTTNEFFVCGTYDGSTITVWKDGAAVATASFSGSITTTALAFNVGNDFNDGGSYQWNGTIDDVRVYNRALTAGEIETLFKSRGRRVVSDGNVVWYKLMDGNENAFGIGTSNEVRDYSGNAHHGTPSSGLLWKASPWIR